MGCTILIAEDEKYVREKVTKNIDWHSHDFLPFEASDGKEALSILETENIDILVTDILMPHMDGIELAKKAKEINEYVRVIVISGHAEFELAQASIRLGVDDYILKPFRSERLLEVVKSTRQRLEIERRKANAYLLQDDIARHLSGEQMGDVFNWLANPDFFIHQSKALNCSRLGQVLKLGTTDELNSEIAYLHRAIDQLHLDKKSGYILLNNVVQTTLETVQEVGFELEQGIDLMTKHLPRSFDGDVEDLKRWVRDFLLDVNTLINSRQQETIEKRIGEMKDYVAKNYRTGVTLSSLAQQLNVSSSYLSKLFYEYVGENFSDYVNKIKAQKAKELLKATDKRIYEIADYLGFNDAYYFSSWFKRIVGCSPTEYRASVVLPEVSDRT